MIDTDLFEMVFSHYFIFLSILGLVTSSLYFSLRGLQINLFHPFTYYYFFQNIVAYSVAIFFPLYFSTNPLMLTYILICIPIIIICIRCGYKYAPENLEHKYGSFFNDISPTHVFIFASIIFSFLILYFLVSGTNTIFAVSRFEAATGHGLIIRTIEAFATVAMCFSVFVTDRYKGIFISIGVSIFAMSSILVAGSKGGALEALLWYVFLSKKLGKQVSQFKVLVIGSLAIVAFIVVLSHNLEATGLNAFNMKGVNTGLPLIYEKAVNRIIANGDMYYFTLVPGVENHISVQYGPTQILFQILGSSLVNDLFGVDLANNEPGRLSFLYWYPDAPMGGPTNHLDLAFYFYMGPLFGLIGVAFIAFLIGLLHGIVTKASKYSFTTALCTVMYSKILIGFLSPSIATQRLFDSIVVITIILLTLKLTLSHIAFANNE